MRILLYSYNYHPEPIGIAPLMTELAEGLVKRGHQVRVVTAFLGTLIARFRQSMRENSTIERSKTELSYNAPMCVFVSIAV
jgi:hypothetical protein